MKKISKILLSPYNRDYKIKKLKSIGLSEKTIEDIENDYRIAYLKTAKELNSETKDIDSNFGNISVYLQYYTDEFKNKFKMNLEKILGY